MRHRSILISCVCLFLSGCAAKPITEENAKSYHNLSPKEFAIERLGNRSAFSFLREKQDLSSPFYFDAFYSIGDSSRLYLPTLEMASFCRSQSGNFLRTATYRGNPTGLGRWSPALAAADSYNYAKARGSSDLFAEKAAVNAYEAANSFNDALARSGIDEADAAVEKGAFGVFECSLPTGSWAIRIVPVGFEPRDPNNLLTAHKLVLEIDDVR